VSDQGLCRAPQSGQECLWGQLGASGGWALRLWGSGDEDPPGTVEAQSQNPACALQCHTPL